MNCRGEATRRELVEAYETRPIAHVQLLSGQTKKSCTGDELSNSYYCFSYKQRQGKKTGTLLCGEHAARHFLGLLGLNPLPLFNPLKSQTAGGGSAGGSSGSVRWDPTSKQLFNAINLLVVAWASPPGPPLADIKSRLERFPHSPPYPGQIKAVNTIISKDHAGRTLQDMVAELAANNDLKFFDFSQLNAVLSVQKVPSSFG